MSVDDPDKLGRAAGAYAKGKYLEAAVLYEQLAEQGHTDSQIFVAWMYHDGVGVGIDRERALRWFLASANSGSPKGMFYCGRLLTAAGKHEEAVGWYRRAAHAGFAPAMFRLGEAYRRRLGVEANRDIALKWYKEAAALGHVFAQRALGLECARGSAGLADTVRGILLLVSAVLRGLWLVVTDRRSEKLLG